MPKHMSAELEKEVLFRLGYGLYALTTRACQKDNVCIVNSVMQITSSPLLIAVCVNKQNYSCGLIQKTQIMNINILTEGTPFEVFRHFGIQSGRNADKLKGSSPVRSYNGLVVLPEYSNGFISLNVEKNLDFGTHILFVCIPTEGEAFSDEPSVTCSYYQKISKGIQKQKIKTIYAGSADMSMKEIIFLKTLFTPGVIMEQ